MLIIVLYDCKIIKNPVAGGRAQQQNKCPVTILLLKLHHNNK